jgi:hypothetical protein
LVMSGLARLAQRFDSRGGGLTFDPGDGSGARLRVWLPRPAPPQDSVSAAEGRRP